MEADEQLQDVEGQETEAAQATEPAEPKGSYPLTDRMIAIAKGEDPDAIKPEVSEESDDEPEVEQPAEEVAEIAEPEKPAAPTSWVTDADRRLAERYGLDAEDLLTYGSREELGRIFRSIDKASSRRQPNPANLQDSQPTKAKEPEAVDDTKPVGPDGKLNLAYYEKNFSNDPDQVELFKAFRAQQDALEELKSSQASYQQQAQERQEQEIFQRQVYAFHDAANGLMPEFLGVTVDKSGLPTPLTQEQQTRRQELFDSANLIADHMAMTQERQGLPVSIPPWPQLLEQAAQLRFGDELAKQRQAKETATREQQLKKAAAQQKRTRGVAQSVSDRAAYRNAPPADPHSTEAILQHPDMQAAFRRIREGSSN